MESPAVRMGVFDHEKLEVYELAVEFVVKFSGISKEIPKGSGYLVNQLQRASSSIALNIAEGAGEFCPMEKARFYRIARRSAFECAAIIDIARNLEIVTVTGREEARLLLLKIVGKLVQLSKSAERRAGARAGARAGTADSAGGDW